jgi:hypothetical protein
MAVNAHFRDLRVEGKARRAEQTFSIQMIPNSPTYCREAGAQCWFD